jgi:hypothetical protein
MFVNRHRTGTCCEGFRTGFVGMVAVLAVALCVSASTGIAEPEKVKLESGRTLKGDAQVGGDIVRLDMGQKGILTLPETRVASVYCPDKGRNIYFRGEARGRRGVEMGTIGGVPSGGGARRTARQQQQSRPAPRSTGGRQGRRMNRPRPPRGMQGGARGRRQGMQGPGGRRPRGGRPQGRPGRRGGPGGRPNRQQRGSENQNE